MFDKKVFPRGLLKIIETLKKKKFAAYVVGGSIRDLLLKLPVFDWDVTTSAPPQEVMKLFKKVVPTGVKYGTVMVVEPDGEYEVTTFRRDERYTDGRRPDKVAFTQDIKEDLSRRDFTINAFAYDPANKELLDLFAGQKDLRNKLIRTVGDPRERFAEDGLRPLRACRFAAKLNFKIEEKTFAAISKKLDKAKRVSLERVHDELVKMMEAGKPSVGIEYMRRSGLLKLYMPELEKGFGIEQNPFHKYDCYWHSLYSCDFAPKKKIVRLAALFHDIAKPACKEGETFYSHEIKGEEVTKKTMKRLKFSNADIQAVTNLVRQHMFDYTNEWSDAAVRRFICRVGKDNLSDLFELRRADVLAMEKEINLSHVDELKKRIAKVFAEDQALHITDLKVDGRDVMKVLGIKQGPQVGKVLHRLLEAVLEDPKLNKQTTLLKIIKENA